MNKGERLTKEDKPINYPYRQVNGYTSYVGISTRPDVCFATAQLSRVQNAPAQKHAKLCERVANYLHHTRKIGIHFKYFHRRILVCQERRLDLV